VSALSLKCFFQRRIRFWSKIYDNWKVTLLPVFLENLKPKTGHDEDWITCWRPQWIHWLCGWQWSSPHCSCYWQRRRCRRNGIKPRRQAVHPLHCTTDCSRVRHPSVERSPDHETDLQLKCLKKTNAQELTAANKQARMTWARQLLEKYPTTMVNFIFFTDEKIFTVAAPTNSQNDCSGTRKKGCWRKATGSTRLTFCKSVTVSVGVSKLGCTAIHFVEPGVKVNAEYYRNNLLGQKLLPDMCQSSQDEFFCVSTGRRTRTSSMWHHHFSGATDTRLHTSDTVAAEFARP